jgi:hypothetical protein
MISPAGTAPLSLPNVSPSGANSGGLTPFSQQMIQPAGPTMVVNVSAGTVVGSGGMDQLAKTIWDTGVRNLQTMGIRLTRG